MEEGQVLRSVPAGVAEALESQNARHAPSPARDAHLRALRDGAPAVVTGQQAGLFLGPLYTVYKAASAVRLARTAGAVPVFWLQTEDHDLAEIASVGVFRPRGPAFRLELAVPPEPVPVAHRVLPPEVEDRHARLAEALGALPHAGETLGRLARHYRPGAGWSEAFAGVLAELFAPEGLVLLDPRDPALGRLAAPVHRRALEGWREVAAALRASGAPETVHVRDDAPLSFFHPDGPEGRRCRLRWTGRAFAEIGGTAEHRLEELLEHLDADPRRFSTSALLRPVLQDTWLPTAAYVGGPAEVAYFRQLGPLYALFGLPPPTVVRRASLRIVEEGDRRRLASLAGNPAPGGGEEVRSRLMAAFDGALAEAAPAVRAAGERAERAAGKTRATVASALEKLARNVDQAARERDAGRAEDERRLAERLLPGGVPQERVVGMTYYAARYGERAFLERVLDAAIPGSEETGDLPL